METMVRSFRNPHDVERTPVRQSTEFVNTCLAGTAAHTLVETSTFMVRARATPPRRGLRSRLVRGWCRLVTDLLVSHSAPLPRTLTLSYSAAQTTCVWRVADPRTGRVVYRDGMSCRTTPSALFSRNT
jgi:hypothetical protein